MPSPAFLNLVCPSCSRDCFEIRALKDEGLATVHCAECHRDYLLLDSGNHWFDVIQGGYPKLNKCSCKAASFRLRCDYVYRDNEDVRSVKISATCSSCGNVKALFGHDIKYSDTGSLVTEPLKFCKNPKILYALQSLTLYATRQDLAELVEFLHSAHSCHFYAKLRENNQWVKHRVDVGQAKAAILGGRKYVEAEYYLWIYASKSALEIPDAAVDLLESEDIFWKRNEVIRIASPFQMGLGPKETLLYYVKFSNEYIDGETIVPKSDAFAELTSSLLAWMKSHFVSWRGPRCFDNPDEHIRIFGDRFAKNRTD